MAETDAKEGSLISDPLDYNFLLIENNAYGDVVAVEDLLSPAEKIAIPPTLLPAGLPPVDKSLIESVREECFTLDEIERTLCKKTQRIWPREIDLNSLYHLEPCPVPTTLQVERNPTTGELLGFYEEESSSGMRLTAKNSCLLSRQPGPPSEAVRGTSTNFPFWPGGMEEPTVKDMMESLPDQTIDFDHGLLTCPPGFQKGMTFKSEDGGNAGPSSAAKLKLNELFAGLDVGDDDDDDENDVSEAEVAADNMEPARSEWLENVLPAEDARVDISSTKSVHSPTTDAARQKGDATPDVTSSATREEWAVRIDVTTHVSDFRQRVPDLAHQWPFELDTFQKQAVIHLENHQSVFVAAHTSAGKTVVAEYAVALAAKHMTRVIYTSPIKALSNQKFRDFKRTFHDVGLITGDVQISPDAFCLIMTTEILRSMLYNGSDVIRDLEWVIFDEVHYINDAERGVVWEEVLIMLPDHCNVILLSATTPNTMEFANWVGRIKKKKIFVISTLKRPVPLVHYLYTGNSNKTSEEMFLLLDADRKFQVGGYKKACAAKSERQSKHSKSFGAKSQRGGNPASEKGVWLSLINRLRKRDQLPVVAFTFSRRRCDENAAALGSLDLTSGAEKSEVHIFFHKCLQRLKGGDRKLPQVIQMATLLERGVGVHHSGILPILKEVVEMLFARGLVKLLFATETFAMGVNMPARTVVFDSLRKHDGTAMRNLLPGEYIQMAGRAGRRGLDPTGNVILLCKGDVPEMAELHTMMLGKPTKLQSQFRLTYGMIVNLLRVEQLRVEEVMKRSFSEFHHRKDSKAQEERLKQLKEEMELRSDVADLLAVTDYRQYLESCQELVEMRANVQRAALNSAAGVRAMQPGRVLLLSHPVYSHHLAAMLKVNTARTEKTFTCLVLCEREEDSGRSGTEHKWHPMTLLGRKLFRPSSFVHQEVIDVTASEISHVTTHTLTLNAERIIEDHKRRQIPRFKADPPDRSTSVATQELLRMAEDEDGVDTVDAVRDLGIKNMETVEQAIRVRSLEESISSAFVCCTLPMFHKQILQVEEYLSLLKERDKLSYLLSEESLHLLPEYQQRVDVLKQLRYVDEGGAVQLKGRVACEISTHEIVLTELVFENVFSSLEAPEIVALLSCAVFQQRVDDAEMEQLPPLLREGMKKIKAVAENVGRIQWERGIPQAVEDFVEELKFGLVEVVYEWARGTSFKDITNLTQVQEGMIVRTIQRLHETCRDVRNAARVIGDPNLHAKMELCSELIKRDIVFAASLYTQ